MVSGRLRVENRLSPNRHGAAKKITNSALAKSNK